MSAAAIGDRSSPLLDDYREIVTSSEGVDELVTLDGVREAAQPLADQIAGAGLTALLAARSATRRFVADDGITYGAGVSPEDSEAPEGRQIPTEPREWELDPLPLTFGAGEWSTLEHGVRQRAALLDAVLTDLTGEQRLVRDGVVPGAAVYGHDGWLDTDARVEDYTPPVTDGSASHDARGRRQGGAGRFLRFLREAADRLDAVFITDEIATGFGRTGTAFACEQAGIVPDVMCVGKALTGGYLTLAALLCSGPVAEVISRSSYAALMHGPTFMANPLACAVAAASVDLLFGRVSPADDAAAAGAAAASAAPSNAAPSSAWYEAVPRLEAGLRAGLAPAASLEGVAEVSVTGGIGVVRTRGPVDVDACTRIAAEHGVWLRPFRDAIYTMPPYVSTEDGLARITAAMVAAAAAHDPAEEDA